MIFVTVGSQMPFDRLIQIVDDWAGSSKRTDIFAQIGKTSLKPKHIQWVESLLPPEFEDYIKKCDYIVSHAGMGTIITSLMHQKPIIVFPRLAELYETRNNHQVSSAEYFTKSGYVQMARNKNELIKYLKSNYLPGIKLINTEASDSLISEIRNFIETTP